MSWDPNQPQGQPPSGPNPYNPQPQATPPQNPYQQPVSGPNPQYTPPPQNPYEQPSGMGPFGAPGYQQSTYGYAPASAPLPLGQAIQGLPNQYLKVTTKPGVQSFAEEQGKADWGIIWIQLLIVGLFGTIIGLLRTAMGMAIATLGSGSSSFASTYAILGGFIGGAASVWSIISVIVGFFIIVGIQYLLAKAFKGEGNFKTQAYDYLLFYVPIAIVSDVVGLIPILGGIVGFALVIYSIVLNVFSIQASHRLSGGKATWVVLIPYIAVILLVLLCAVVFVALIFHAASSAPSY